MLTTVEADAIIAADREEALDDLLSRWDHWAHGEKVCRGYAPKSLVCGDFRISRQYDDANGALDDAIEDRIMRAVDAALGAMLDPWRSAMYCQARNLRLGLAVWSSPRLPRDKEGLRVVVATGRRMLIAGLTSSGVM